MRMLMNQINNNSKKTTENITPASGNVKIKNVRRVKKEIRQDSSENRKKAAFWAIIAVAVIILLSFVIYMIASGGKNNNHSHTVGDVQMYNPKTAMVSLKANEPEGISYPEGIQEKFKPLYAANQTFVGWLSVPNTSIDTAVYQAKDNDYYLKKDLWGNYSRYGTVFLDYCDSVSNMKRNTVIYGHNFDDDGNDSYDDYIFGDVHKYLDVEFYRTAPVIEFNTLYKDYKWKVIDCMVTNGDSTGDNDYLFFYIATSMNNDNFTDYINELSERSYIHTTVDVQPDDKILTLSTCSYLWDRNGSLQNVRCVLVARMIRDGESEEVDVQGATQNENPRFPQLYYDVFGGSNPYADGSKWRVQE